MVKILTRARLITSLLRRCSRVTSLLLPKSKLEAPQKVNGTTRRRTVAEHLGVTTPYEPDLYLNHHGSPKPLHLKARRLELKILLYDIHEKENVDVI